MASHTNENTELGKLKQKIAGLEKLEQQHKKVEAKLKTVNKQLQASENQLKAYNEQLRESEQKLNQQKEAAEQSREFAESIIDTIRQPLLVLDKNLRVITANQYFYKLFQVSPESTKGNLLYNLGKNQWDIPELKELLKKTLPEFSAVEDFEVEYQFETIGHKIMLLNARELLQKQGKERLILLAIEDVTKSRIYKKELERLNKELEIKAEELQQILYITTHDLRSPLVNIQGFTKEMEASLNDLKKLLEKMQIHPAEEKSLNTIMDEEIPEAIHYITSSTTKMDNLLKGLLSLSRLGRQKLTFRKLDMNRLMQQVLDDFEFEIGKNQVNIEVGNLPDCMGDDLQINQLFSNLIGNSLKFLKPEVPGEIVISGGRVENGCRFVVKDNGIGIPREYQEKIFGLFEKLDPKKPGIGLGMNVVKQVVEKHNGSIEMESELGKGMKFSIFIPD
ncbi:PAS fold [Tangfeifania diversioriginum]|uniref:histidine kinase n=1 Tax=Tangfeifania diversioriginum TaxID=1168035 RepID=A0A1M6NQH0_9BACT|nr:PAS domain-containing sensor histidine kinase [Tangfeifania diversioriginum]SHJ97987.1 PAS fold [Tangfeifania diversioriginum]